MSEKDNKKPMKKEKYVSLDEKIKIFEEYLLTEKEIVGKTVYKGYPIGMWAIQIRRKIKIHKMGLKGGINPSKEKMKKLKSLGILERQRETLDEKMEYLMRWVEKYPDVKIVWEIDAEKKLREYAESEDEYNKILLMYKRARKCYTYVCDRNSRGELPKEYFEKCKEAKLNPDIFGYSTHIEDLSKKYGLELKKVDYLLEKYGSIQNFVRLYRNQKLKNDDFEFANRTIKSYIDIDENPYSDNYDKLIEEIYGKKQDIVFYSSKKLQEVINGLGERQTLILKEHYGLENGEIKMLKTIAEERNISKSGVSYIAKTTLEKMRKNYKNYEKIFVLSKIEDKPDFQKDVVDVFRETLDKSNIVFKTVKNSENELSKYFYSTKFENFRKMIELHDSENMVYKEEKSTNRDEDEINIDELGLSLRARNCLKRAGYYTFEQLIYEISRFKEDDGNIDDFFSNIRGCGTKSADEIKKKIESMNNKDEMINLEVIKLKRDKLQEELLSIREREIKAKELLEQYNDILGENKKFKGEK